MLEDVSFTARQGEVTALIGPSGGGSPRSASWQPGSGTSPAGRCLWVGRTCLRWIRDPSALLLHGVPGRGAVPGYGDGEHPPGRRGATDEEVLEAAKAAQCDEFIRKLPQGYQTVIGENGSTLSGGERQRISIARALLKDAPVVLLDEATASLDVENESAVQTALSRLLRGKTVLVIAHRMPHRGGSRPHRGAGERPCGPAGHPGRADGAGRPLPPHGGAPERERPVAPGFMIPSIPVYLSCFSEYNILWRSRHYGDALPKGAVLPLFSVEASGRFGNDGSLGRDKNERRQPAEGQETGAALLYYSGPAQLSPL